VDERPFVAGCFIWTGFDYRGEPQPYSWPAAGASFGLMDQCGFPKFAYYIRQAQWLQKPVLQLVPHWNWPTEMIGKPVKIMAATNVERVKLILNGKEVGDKKVDKYEMADWMIPYQPGKLVAIGYNGTKEVARFTVETTGEPVALQLIPDRKTMVNDSQDAMPVTVQAIDSKGRAVPTSNISVQFEVTGSGSIIGLGNGNPNSHESEKGTSRKLFNGLAQVILQTNQTAGMLTLTAKANGLKSATISIPVKDTIQIPEVSVAKPVLILNKWRVSPVSDSKPNATQDIADYDMNTWTNSNGSNPTTFTETGFIIYRSNFKPFFAQQANGGQIVFKNIVGKAEFWLDKKLVGSKLTSEKKDITIEFPPKKGEFKLSVVFEAAKNEKAGVAGVVSVGEKE
jgi:beta-galactosidase